MDFFCCCSPTLSIRSLHLLSNMSLNDKQLGLYTKYIVHASDINVYEFIVVIALRGGSRKFIGRGNNMWPLGHILYLGFFNVKKYFIIISQNLANTPTPLYPSLLTIVVAQTSYYSCIYSCMPVLHDWCNKGRCMCYPVCGMVYIKEPLLLIGKKISHVAAAGFLSRYLNGPLPYVRRHITVNKMC